MSNPFLRRIANNGKLGKAGRQSEKAVAKKLGGTLTPASGAGSSKGDIQLESFMLECKSTTNDSISLKREWLLKVLREAQIVGKTPALTLTFTDDTGKPKQHGTWVCIPDHVFKELIGGQDD